MKENANEKKNVAVELRGITKTFGSFVANSKIDFDVRYGEVHGLLGENGAGKSTLMNVLFGLLAPDHGEILVNGEPRNIRGPHDAMTLGIQMVHQHFMLALPYKGWENVILGEEPEKYRFFIDKKKSYEEMQKAAALCGFKLDPDQTVLDMSIPARQKLEIVRALFHKCNVIILDEPTAVLSESESDELLSLIRKLRDDGKAIIIITHKLREAMQICDRITVLRHGEVVLEEKTENVTKESLATAMVGHPVLFELPSRVDVKDAAPIVQFENVSTGSGKANLHDVSLEICGGEIFGIAGVEGNGQRDLVNALLGLQKVKSGEIQLHGHSLAALGSSGCTELIAHVAEDRHMQGYINEFSIVENVMLGRQGEGVLQKKNWVNKRAAREMTREIVEKFDVRISSIEEPAGSLSGGNQQKLLIGREFTKPNIELVIAEQPSRGLDIASTEYVHQCLIEMRNKGKAIILITADLDELMSLSDRVGVIYDGSFVAFGKPGDFTATQLGLYMTGGKAN